VDNKKIKMRIQLDFKITNKMHSLYQSYFSNPPFGVEYFKSEFRGINKRSFGFFKKVYHLLKNLGFFHQKVIDRLNDSLRKDLNFDLIHFANHLGKTNKIFVIDYETVGSFIGTDFHNQKFKNSLIKILNKKNLKFFLPINKEALKSFKLFFGDSIKKNQEVIYPVTFIPKKFRKTVNRENLVVFAGSSNIRNEDIFYAKGGYETLLSFEILAKKFKNYKFVFIGDIPGNIKISKEENIILKEVVPIEELYGILNKSKIFLQPCYSTPAMMFLISRWFKLPIVTYDFWANKEYVNYQNGILINPEKTDALKNFNIPMVNKKVINQIKENSKKNSKRIVKAIEKLIKNENLMKKMGEEGFKLVSEGKFSVENRNKKILRIYREALK